MSNTRAYVAAAASLVFVSVFLLGQKEAEDEGSKAALKRFYTELLRDLKNAAQENFNRLKLLENKWKGSFFLYPPMDRICDLGQLMKAGSLRIFVEERFVSEVCSYHVGPVRICQRLSCPFGAKFKIKYVIRRRKLPLEIDPSGKEMESFLSNLFVERWVKFPEFLPSPPGLPIESAPKKLSSAISEKLKELKGRPYTASREETTYGLAYDIERGRWVLSMDPCFILR